MLAGRSPMLPPCRPSHKACIQSVAPLQVQYFAGVSQAVGTFQLIICPGACAFSTPFYS